MTTGQDVGIVVVSHSRALAKAALGYAREHGLKIKPYCPFIAGYFSNSPENMASWLQDPQKALPGNAMPRMGVTTQDSRDITAFLYTLK